MRAAGKAQGRAIPRGRAITGAAALLGGLLTSFFLIALGASDRATLMGFTAASAPRERAVERTLTGVPDATAARRAHRFLTEEPHLAGTPRDRVLAEWVRDRWKDYGIEDVEIAEHQVLLPYPEEVTVELTEPTQWRASMKEDGYPLDKDTYADDVGLPYNAYSASGETAAEVVYAHSGNPEDYDRLKQLGIDIKGRIALVRYSVPYSYRGFKALTAQQRGAAGVLMYSDPADDGYVKGDAYPNGPWGPESHIQRGGVPYDFLIPGDPLTPGWASVEGARRIPKEEAVSLPKIMSAPMSYKDARVILEHLGGPAAPEGWQGGLPFTYHVGPGPARVHLKLRMDDAVRPIWTVVGRIRGRDEPDRLVIVGNHRDAWIFGGRDPSSGTATMMELARAMGRALKNGDRPKRTIVFCNWDAEEFTLTSSTEWGEQYADTLKKNAVAYLNVDASASGPNLQMSAVPALNRLIEEAAEAVIDPASTGSLRAAWAARHRESSAGETGGGRPNAALVENRLGSGSDYTVFLNFLGIPIADMTFEGPYGVYHSMYDDHFWMSQFGDPGFYYHAAMARLWGVTAWRLANADVLPLDYGAYARAVGSYLDLARDPNVDLTAARAAAARWERAADEFGARVDRVLRTPGAPPAAEVAAINQALLSEERALLSPQGIPGRPWYKHLIYAPKFTYAAEVLPAVTEAIQDKDWPRAREQARRIADALTRAAELLESVK